MSKTIYVLNGPNLNMLGRREPTIYGGTSLDDIRTSCMEIGQQLGLTLDFRQSNHEGALVDWIQEAQDKAAGIVINPGAYSHTSIALHDAIRATGLPVIEVHLSNIHARETFRHTSFVTPVAVGMISGLGLQGYVLALRAIADIVE